MSSDLNLADKDDGTSVLLIDDHYLVAQLTATFLPKEGSFTVTLTDSVNDALDTIASRGAFDIVLLDVYLPEEVTVEQVASIVRANEPGKVLLFSGNVRQNFMSDCILSGAYGFIPKTLSLRSLTSAINLAASGEPFVPAGYFNAEESPSKWNEFDLTPDELKVLEKLGQGWSNKEIMNALDIPDSTVKMRVRMLSRKLGARNRTHAVIIAREAGVI